MCLYRFRKSFILSKIVSQRNITCIYNKSFLVMFVIFFRNIYTPFSILTPWQFGDLINLSYFFVSRVIFFSCNPSNYGNNSDAHITFSLTKLNHKIYNTCQSLNNFCQLSFNVIWRRSNTKCELFVNNAQNAL